MVTTCQGLHRAGIRGSCGSRRSSRLKSKNWVDGLSKGIRPKVRNLMSAIYRFGQKLNKIPRPEECNPMRWVSVGTTSDYEAVVVTPEQAWSIAETLPLYERTLVITDSATGCRISECLHRNG